MNVPIRPAATLLLVRDGASGVEVLLVQRARTMRFLPGYIAFPGGAVSAEDERLVERYAIGRPMAAQAADDDRFAVAALRETAEEIGWLCALASPDGPEDRPLTRDEQCILLQDDHEITTWLDRERLRFDLRHLRFVGRWVTPPSQPARFDTRFFVYAARHVTHPQISRQELAAALWRGARETLADVESGRLQAVRPTVAMLRGLARCATVAEVMDSLDVPGPPPVP
ncbi:MAG: NUDIX domain-containing protein [Thermoflavifilum sp.]|nr:NUDIX domain-containing protein [Thermoflavifilum sp.]MCL6514612.1 NUDIX domain-containing protein [Alicyclobacillus sp.]